MPNLFSGGGGPDEAERRFGAGKGVEAVLGREILRRWSNLAFAGMFAGAILLFGRIVLPFLMPVLLGAFLVVLFEPVRARVARSMPNHPQLTATVCTLLVLLSTLGPILLAAVLISRELLVVGAYARTMLDDPALRRQLMADLPDWLANALKDPAGLKLEKEAFTLLAGGVNVVTAIIAEGSEIVADAVLMSISTYYFFLDGKRLYRSVRRLIPVERRYLDAFADEFKGTAFALVYGNIITGILQGLTGWLGFWLAQIPRAHVWALVMVAVSFLPVGGTALVWLPMGAYLLFTHQAAAGLFILGWGAVMVGVVDNLARPRLCSARMAVHPLLVFVSMFGGFAVFGMMGVLVGPLVASLFMSMIRIYRRDFLPDHAHELLGGDPPPAREPVRPVSNTVITPAPPLAAEGLPVLKELTES